VGWPTDSWRCDRPAPTVADTLLCRHCRSAHRAGSRAKRNRPTPSGDTAEFGRRHERANSEGRTSPDACFLGEQERRARRSSRPPRVSRQRVLPRDCASQGRRPHGARPPRSCLCSRGVRRTASRCCVPSIREEIRGLDRAPARSLRATALNRFPGRRSQVVCSGVTVELVGGGWRLTPSGACSPPLPGVCGLVGHLWGYPV